MTTTVRRGRLREQSPRSKGPTIGVSTRRQVILAVLVTALALGEEASAQGLAGLHRVSLSVDLQYPIDDLSIEDLLARLEEGIRGAHPAMGVNESATDRLRLVVSV